jgi:hypothetical protein
MPEGAVSVTRPGRWGNPFIVGKDGGPQYCVVLYGRMLTGLFALCCTPSLEEQQAARRYVIDHVDDLRGKDLACWCRLDKPCHADVLLRLANAPLSCEAV